MEWIKIIDFNTPGPTTLVVGLVHGNEVVGAKAIEYLHQKITASHDVRGRIITLYANLKGQQQDRRFIDHDLNRAFALAEDASSYEISRAKEIKNFFADMHIDYLFDLHSTSSKSDPMILCTSQKSSLDLASKMPIRHVVQWLIDIVEWTSLVKYFQNNITLGMAFECGCHKDEDTIVTWKKIIDVIIDFHQGKQLPDQTDQIKIHITDLILTSDPGFTYSKPYQWFELLQKWEIRGKDMTGDYSFDIPKILVMPNMIIAQELEKKNKVGVAYFWDDIGQ